MVVKAGVLTEDMPKVEVKKQTANAGIKKVKISVEVNDDEEEESHSATSEQAGNSKQLLTEG